MAEQQQQQKNEEEENNNAPAMTALFQNNDNDDDNLASRMAELFTDRVRKLHEYYDTNQDGYLNFDELSALQRATSDDGVILTKDMYVMACKALDCQPHNGISLGALKLTYASDGADINKDYYKVFPEKKPKQQQQQSKEEDRVYEIGEDGFDISP